MNVHAVSVNLILVLSIKLHFKKLSYRYLYQQYHGREGEGLTGLIIIFYNR